MRSIWHPRPLRPVTRQHRAPDGERADSLASGVVTSFAEAADGTLWTLLAHPEADPEALDRLVPSGIGLAASQGISREGAKAPSLGEESRGRRPRPGALGYARGPRRSTRGPAREPTRWS